MDSPQGLAARFDQLRKEVLSWELDFVQSAEAGDFGLVITFSCGTFPEARLEVRYEPTGWPLVWTPIIVPRLFYGLRLNDTEEKRVFLIKSGMHRDGLPEEVYCWDKDLPFAKALFSYAPLRSSIRLLPPLAVMPDAENGGWLEVRPLPGSEANPKAVLWFMCTLNAAWSLASGKKCAGEDLRPKKPSGSGGNGANLYNGPSGEEAQGLDGISNLTHAQDQSP